MATRRKTWFKGYRLDEERMRILERDYSNLLEREILEREIKDTTKVSYKISFRNEEIIEQSAGEPLLKELRLRKEATSLNITFRNRQADIYIAFGDSYDLPSVYLSVDIDDPAVCQDVFNEAIRILENSGILTISSKIVLVYKKVYLWVYFAFNIVYLYLLLYLKAKKMFGIPMESIPKYLLATIFINLGLEAFFNSQHLLQIAQKNRVKELMMKCYCFIGVAILEVIIVNYIVEPFLK